MNPWLRRLAALLLALLAVQFLLGMVANFYAPIPDVLPDQHGNVDARLGAAARWGLLRGPLEVRLHVAIGLAIGACAILLAVLAIRASDRRWRVFASLGVLMVGPAGLAGAAFLAYRQDDAYSLLMAIGFLGALFAYWAGLYFTRCTCRTTSRSRSRRTSGSARTRQAPVRTRPRPIR